MFLKNYTSGVPVSQTIYRIEQTLIKCGVLGITKEYAPDGTVGALVFRIPINDKEHSVRLPAKKEEAMEALWAEYDKTHTDKWRRGRKTKKDFADQAERTAWKLAQDWVSVQMSMVQLQQAEVAEVFMPYIWDESQHQTLFQSIKAVGFKALPAPK